MRHLRLLNADPLDPEGWYESECNHRHRETVKRDDHIWREWCMEQRKEEAQDRPNSEKNLQYLSTS
jgi:hypothetical protein